MSHGRGALHGLVAASLLLLAMPVAGLASVPAIAPPSSSTPGVTCALFLATNVDVDGDTKYAYELPNGLQVLTYVAAPGLSTTSSPSRLAKFGLGPPPALISDAYSAYALAVANLARQPAPSAPCVNATIRNTLTSPSANYSGYAAQAASGKTFSGANSSYTAPSYFLSICGNESMSQWVGVANLSTGNLMQAGLYANQWTGTAVSGAFWEVVGGSWSTNGQASFPTNVPYVAGDRYYFNVQYEDRYDLGFFVQNLDTGATGSFQYHNPAAGATNYQGPIGWFTSERQTVVSGGVDYLTEYMNHTNVRFRSATVHILPDGSDARMSIEQPFAVDMADTTSTVLGYPNSLDVSASNFTETWSDCGEVEQISP
jgi:hypothetical protein